MADHAAKYEALETMYTTFHREGKNFRGLASKVSPAVASSGDAALDHSINAVAELIKELHDALATRIEDHGKKVEYATNSFRNNDANEAEVYEDLTDDKHKAW
ncbi:DUF6317 family protein [Streptomyces orinoci]|uniref:DUF6317 family protein n=1 Tax=Streptomyces orinoci TaxID=67339 RepID=A0ABV3K2Y5_STRON|nr:DUF6317 family protein [Streptomyces orinoci]